VDPGLRRDDVEIVALLLRKYIVMPAKALTQVSAPAGCLYA
jgi:hypothetical protein